MIPDPNTRRPAIGGGFFDEVHCRAEIAELQAHGLNSIRIVGSFYAWLCYPDYYRDCLRRLCRICREKGVAITYCLWNTTQWGYGAHDGQGSWPLQMLAFHGYLPPPNQVLLDLMFGIGKDWPGHTVAWPDANITQFAEPGPDWIWNGRGLRDWDTNFILRIEEYLTDICRFFDTDLDGSSALGSIDLYNEPDVLWAPTSGPQLPHRIDPVMEFIKWTYKAVRENAPKALCTVGWADLTSAHARGLLDHNELLRKRGVDQDYYSFHSYHTPEAFHGALALASSYFSQPLPVACSEFWKAEFRHGLGSYLSELRAFGFGGQMWGFLQHNAYYYDPVLEILTGDVDGVMIPERYDRIQAAGTFSFTPASEADERSVSAW